jgi:hypothetical protein
VAETLATLIKLAERKVEAAQQELAAAARLLELNKMAEAKWLAALEAGHAAALGDSTGLGLAQDALFGRRAAAELARLAEMAAVIGHQMAEIRARLAGHFAEQKRFEVLLAQQRMKEKKKHFKKVQAALDESAQHKVR